MEKETFSFTWKEAEVWQERANEEVQDGVKWRWDCNYKLDFDGGIVNIESRFYPPHKNSSEKWEGTINVSIANIPLWEYEIKADTLEQVKQEAVKYLKRQTEIIKSKLINN